MGEWIKRRGPEPWHLIDSEPQRSVACGTPDVPDADPVSWTDPDSYPPEAERCAPCQSIFSGAVSAMALPTERRTTTPERLAPRLAR